MVSVRHIVFGLCAVMIDYKLSYWKKDKMLLLHLYFAMMGLYLKPKIILARNFENELMF